MLAMSRSTARALAATALLAAVGALAAGCAATAMKPWDRDLLAKKKMQFAPSPVHYAIDQHIYFSKEGSTGGLEVGGGGCGCN
jgi:Domain of unknown function (DUF4266)